MRVISNQWAVLGMVLGVVCGAAPSTGRAQTIYVINSYRYTTNEFSPTNMAGLALWLKADAISASDGDTIQTWPDSSGNAKDGVQTTASKRPRFTNSVAAINNKATLYFDGSDDDMVVTNLTLSSYSTVYIVAKAYGGYGSGWFLEHGPNYNSTDGFGFSSFDGYVWAMRRTSLHNERGPMNNGSDWTGLGWTTSVFVYNGASSAYYKNGVLQTSTAIDGSDVGDSDTTNTLNIQSNRGGGLAFERANISEILIYNNPHNSGDRGQVEDFLRTKYAHY